MAPFFLSSLLNDSAAINDPLGKYDGEPGGDLTETFLVSIKSQKNSEISPVRLRPGLPAKELESALISSNRASDISRRALSFYLSDMHKRGLHQALGFASAVHFAQSRLSMSRRQARYLLLVGTALIDLPLIDEAFCQGVLSWSKVRSLVAVATGENEKVWLERALSLSCQQLEAEIRGAEKGRPPRQDGKGTPHVRFRFAAQLAPTAHEVFEKARQKLNREAGVELGDEEVLIALAESCLRRGGKESKSEDSLFRVAIGQCTDCSKSHVHTEDGPVELSSAEAEAVRCDGEVMGRNKDAPTPSGLRRRVLARDGNRCVNCSSASNLHAHHIVFRADGGRTDSSNLVTLCARCHGMVHDGFLFVSGLAPHDLSIRDRHGRDLKSPLPQSFKVMSMKPVDGGTRVPSKSSVASGQRLSELIGQDQVRESLQVACRAAKVAKRPVRHVLLSGPPGLGKTTIARAVAVESGVPFVECLGPAISAAEELCIVEGGVLFIDEIHGLPRSVAESLYATMDEKKICVIGATTNPNLMPEPLRDRFTMQEEFFPYGESELAHIVVKASASPIDVAASMSIAKASMGTPRRALSLLAATEDQLLARGLKRIDQDLVRQTLRLRRLDPRGLSSRQLQALAILRTGHRPMGKARLAGSMGIDSKVFGTTVEPDLLRLGLIAVTPEGLIAV